VSAFFLPASQLLKFEIAEIPLPRILQVSYGIASGMRAVFMAIVPETMWTASTRECGLENDWYSLSESFRKWWRNSSKIALYKLSNSIRFYIDTKKATLGKARYDWNGKHVRIFGQILSAKRCINRGEFRKESTLELYKIAGVPR